jgi:hypothetical protein
MKPPGLAFYFRPVKHTNPDHPFQERKRIEKTRPAHESESLHFNNGEDYQSHHFVIAIKGKG